MFLVVIIICNFIGCGVEPDLAKKSSNEQTVEVTINDIVSAFDENLYQIQNYDSEMIAEIHKKLSLDGEILSVVHAAKFENEGSELEWAYIYELSNDDDAIWLEENRATFVSTIDNGICIRLNNIVIFGNSAIIQTLK